MLPKVDAIITDNGQEVKAHGTDEFPCAVYQSRKEFNYFPWHWHEEYELTVVEEGHLKYYSGQKCYELEAGDGIFFNSGTLHCVPEQKSLPCYKKDVVFHGRMIYGTYDSVLWQKYMQPLTACPELSAIVLRRSVPWQAEILDYIDRTYKAFEAQTYGYEFEVKEILVNIFRIIFINCRENLTSEMNHSSKETMRVKQMLKFIHSHYRENINVSLIAASANICERECLRCFKEFIRLSPIQYLIHYRINQACRMLKDGQSNITEISSSCGFESPSYFSKMFKRVIGCTPRNYGVNGGVKNVVL